MGINIVNFSNKNKKLPLLNFTIHKGDSVEERMNKSSFTHFMKAILLGSKFSGEIVFEESKSSAVEFLRKNSYFLLKQSFLNMKDLTVRQAMQIMYQTSRTNYHINSIISGYFNINDLFDLKISELSNNQKLFLNIYVLTYSGKKINFINAEIFNNADEKQKEILHQIFSTKLSHSHAIVMVDLYE